MLPCLTLKAHTTDEPSLLKSIMVPVSRAREFQVSTLMLCTAAAWCP